MKYVARVEAFFELNSFFRKIMTSDHRVEDEQRELILPGAPFYWMIGYRVRAGSRSRFSEISFRRLLTWTKKELEEAELEATKLDEEAGWTDSSESAAD
jgi:hypothetical protein